ncbi:aminotransferase class V-fold PLP-dependent enzyme [Microbulbifer echini]|uniref:Aminotransferase class V-fold PLP-dependent enzyme n=1 Tax=Microbulbifer echini TaxID=1529067 RepID=A0ABV4NLE3_9GAMM|nr:aminotransferase class V-fold PLP-dependent enzyme [uncultured Microbulbifer sp.]
MITLIKHIRESVIGDRLPIPTPFGSRPLIYADYTASGRSLSFIEDAIRQRVLPFYANTHSESSYTGAQTSALREEAREEIRRAVNAGPEHKVIFCGSGATAAINKLIDILNLRLPADLNERYQLLERIPQEQRPVVFIGPYEHHSNELPWRESIAELVSIPLDSDGSLDTESLENHLCTYAERPLKIGSFSAASNVTGIITDIKAVTRLLHTHGALSFWDYAAAAPYLKIDMCPAEDSQEYATMEAVFISPHKFVGGPGTPGVLIAHQKLLQNSVPATPGGGTVLYVTPEDHRYLKDPERCEEGGTPAIVESIRAGMVFKLQSMVGTDEITRREEVLVKRALRRWSQVDNLEILGSLDAPRLSIVSLRVRWQDKDLHYGFVVALLNDLFGIQARGGCSCAGPYGHTLLGLDMDYSHALEKQIIQGQKLLRPGWVRLNFNYFIDDEVFEYLLEAVALIARHGWRLLPYYAFDTTQAVWRYQNTAPEPRTSLAELDFLNLEGGRKESTQPLRALGDYLAIAKEALCCKRREAHYCDVTLPAEAEALRWFVSPGEAARAL